jgi:hypothetical protein
VTRSAASARYHPWATFATARELARRRGDARVSTEHLLVALLDHDEVARALGVTRARAVAALDAVDADALGAVGIVIRTPVPLQPARTPAHRPITSTLADRLPMTPAAKAVLRDAGRPRRRGGHVTACDLARALLDVGEPDPCAHLLVHLDVDAARARSRLAVAAA